MAAPRRTTVLAVVGDAGSGKTSLVTAACQEQYSSSPVPVLPPARFPADVLGGAPDGSGGGELLVVDTSSKPEGAGALGGRGRRAEGGGRRAQRGAARKRGEGRGQARGQGSKSLGEAAASGGQRRGRPCREALPLQTHRPG
jgi:hypothetical protein